MASLTGYMPMPGMAVYAASKAFVLRFTEALAYERHETPLAVLALVPGPTRTDFYRASGSSEKGVAFQAPDEVVTTALSALDKKTPPRSVISGARNRWTSRIVTWLPDRTVLRLANASPDHTGTVSAFSPAAPTTH